MLALDVQIQRGVAGIGESAAADCPITNIPVIQVPGFFFSRSLLLLKLGVHVVLIGRVVKGLGRSRI
jgi:hypothetical protein